MGIKCPQCHFENPDDTRFCGNCATPLPSPEEISPTKTLETPKEELTTGSTFAGRYQIIEELGKGGMGKVYKVLDQEIKGKVALKLIRPEIAADKKTIERFRNELKVARDISHKNICRMYDLNKEEGTYYITMEYVSGEDLKSSIRRLRQLTPGTAILIAKQVCEGLAEAHRLGVVHRDLKPQNIMIDKEGNSRIMDFGIARSLKVKGITGAGVMIGTPEYMSPEQVEGKEVDQRSDIYSLGVILYEMVTGQVPFEGDTPFTIGVKHKSEEPRDPKEINAQIPEDLSRVILRCMEKNKEKRYQSAGELSSELTNIEKGIPTTERVVPKRKPITSREITVTFGLKKLFIPGLVVAALVIAAVIIWQILPKKEAVPIPSDKPSLAVMYFENRTAEPDLDKIFVDMLTTNLSRYEGIEVVSRQRLFDLLKQIGKQDTESIDKNVATELANRAGVRTMLLGSIIKIGDKIRITSHLTNVQDGAIIGSTQIEGSKIEDIFDMVDELTEKVGNELGISVEESGQRFKIADATTSSFEAYKYYQKGVDAYHRLYSEKAAGYFQKAVEIDPSFAMAYAYMALSSNLFAVSDPFADLSSQKKTLEQAKKYAYKVTDKERRAIDGWRAFYNRNFELAYDFARKLVEENPEYKQGYFILLWSSNAVNEPESSKIACEKLLEMDPTDGPAYNMLSYIHSSMGNHPEAISAIKKYIALLPDDWNPYDSAWEIHMRAGKFDEAIRYSEEALKRNSDWRWFHRYIGYTLLLKGEGDEARTKFSLEADLALARVVGRTRDAGCSYLFEGRYKEAQAEFRKGVELAQKENNAEKEMFARFNLGKMLVVQKKYDQAIKEYTQGEKLSWEIYSRTFNPVPIITKYLIGIALVNKGDFTAAQNRAEEIRRIIQKQNFDAFYLDFHYLLLGELHTAQKKGKAAQENIDKTSGITKYYSPHYRKLAASGLALQGHYEKAIQIYQEIYGSVEMRTYGMGDYFDFFRESSRVDYNIAKIYEKMGNRSKAIEHYEKFLDLWKDANPGIAEVEDASKRLAGVMDQ
jgi:tetratricopeptide (TPR) repeat protein/tRNA A-37 threonylcarbamoyl transferase component Bud32